MKSHEEGALDSKDTVRKQRKEGIGIRNSSTQEERKLAAVLIHLSLLRKILLPAPILSSLEFPGGEIIV